MRDQSYWSTVAQVMPVLGLALVVEARQIWNHREEYNRFGKLLLVILYGLPLLVFVFGEAQALSALRNQGVWPGSPYVVNNAISGALTILLVAPGVAYLSIASRRLIIREYFRAAFFSLRAKNHFRVFKMKRNLRRFERAVQGIDDQVAQLSEDEQVQDANVEEIRKEKRELLDLRSRMEEGGSVLRVMIKRLDGQPKFPTSMKEPERIIDTQLTRPKDRTEGQ